MLYYYYITTTTTTTTLLLLLIDLERDQSRKTRIGALSFFPLPPL